MAVCTYHSKRPEILTAFGRNISTTVRHASNLREIGLDWLLTLDDQHQGIDLANGAAGGLAVLIAPDDAAEFAKEQL